MAEKEKNLPLKTFKTAIAWGVNLTAWEGNDGKLSFNVSKSYKAKDGWRPTKVLFTSDLAALQQLIPQAIAWQDAYKTAKMNNAEPAAELPEEEEPF